MLPTADVAKPLETISTLLRCAGKGLPGDADVASQTPKDFDESLRDAASSMGTAYPLPRSACRSLPMEWRTAQAIGGLLAAARAADQ